METILLKDADTGTFVYREERDPGDCFATALMRLDECYFAYHYVAYKGTSPKKFIMYYSSPDIPAARAEFQLLVEKFVVQKGIIGQEPAEYEYPYRFHEGRREMIDPKDFPDENVDITPPEKNTPALFP